MPQITTIRVMRKRSVQPEQFGNATAEVELTGNVLEGEDPKTVARQMLVDSRSLVYENLGLRLPASVVEAAEAVDTPQETATVEATTEETTKKGRGRPRGSKNTAPKKETAKAKREREAAEAAAAAESEVPGDDAPNISTGDARVGPDDDPDDHGVPGDEEVSGQEPAVETEMDAGQLNEYINGSIRESKLTGQQAKQMMREMKIARIRDLDTSDKVTKAKTMIDSFIKANGSK